MAEIVSVSFYGDALLAGCEGDRVFVSIRRITEALGIDFSTQLSRLKQERWATVGQSPMVADDGKTRLVSTIDVDALPMWLATISAERVRESAREKLVRYQLECARVLRERFNRSCAMSFDPSHPRVVAAVLEAQLVKVRELEAAVSEKNERIDVLERRAAQAEEHFDRVRGAAALQRRMEVANGMFGFREAARAMGVRSGQLVAFLLAESYCYRLGKQRRLAAMARYLHMTRPLFHEAVDELTSDAGQTITSRRTWITPHGLERFAAEYPAWAARQHMIAAGPREV